MSLPFEPDDRADGRVVFSMRYESRRRRFSARITFRGAALVLAMIYTAVRIAYVLTPILSR